MTCKLGITFVDESKIYAWNNLARVADEEHSGPGLWEFVGERGYNSAETAY